MNLQNRTEALPIRIKKPAAELVKQLQQLQQAQKQKTKPKKAKVENIEATAARIINDEMGRRLSQKGIQEMYSMAAIMEGMLAFYRGYRDEVMKIELDYDAITSKFNLHKKEEKRLQDAMLKVHKLLIGNFANFEEINMQMVNMVNRADKKQQEKLQDIEDNIYDDLVAAYNTKDANLSTYIKPAHTCIMQYHMKAEDICKYLITVSKGACIHWPTSIGKELLSRGFERNQTGYYVELVTQPE